MSKARPFFKTLPAWIYDSAEYAGFNAGQILFLHLIAGKCDQTLADQSTRGCRVGGRLIQTSGINRASAFRYLALYRKLGFVVKVGQGGGKTEGGSGLANEYGVPAKPGSLDHLKIGDDQRYKTYIPSQRETDIPSHSATHTVSPCDSNRLTVRPSNNSSSLRNNCLNTSKAISDPVFFNDDDDDKAEEVSALELPDDASEQQVAKALNKHGVDLAMARSMSKSVRAEAAREAINLSYENDPRNRGGYIVRLIQGGEEEQAARFAEERAALHEKAMQAIQHLTERVDAMPDDELSALIAEYLEATNHPPEGREGYTVEFVRGSKGFREALGRHLANQSAQEVEV